MPTSGPKASSVNLAAPMAASPGCSPVGLDKWTTTDPGTADEDKRAPRRGPRQQRYPRPARSELERDPCGQRENRATGGVQLGPDSPAELEVAVARSLAGSHHGQIRGFTDLR
jgi:hypothetical protein